MLKKYFPKFDLKKSFIYNHFVAFILFYKTNEVFCMMQEEVNCFMSSSKFTTKFDFNSLDDEQVVELAVNGDEKAVEFILNKYKPLVKFRANMYYLIGGDKDDLIQEGMIGLFKAIKSYKVDQDTSFKAFADICIRRHIITAVKSATRKKHMPLNSYVSLNKPLYDGENKDNTVMDFIDNNSSTNPEEMLIDKEDLNNIETKIKSVLSSYEIEVLKLFLSGRSYPDISRILNKDHKSIDNALQRARKKLETSLGYASSQEA